MRPDNGPAMNTMAMKDFDSPRDSRYGEAGIARVNMLYGTRVRLETHRMTSPRTTMPGDP